MMEGFASRLADGLFHLSHLWSAAMTTAILLSDAQMDRISPFFLLSYGGEPGSRYPAARQSGSNRGQFPQADLSRGYSDGFLGH